MRKWLALVVAAAFVLGSFDLALAASKYSSGGGSSSSSGGRSSYSSGSSSSGGGSKYSSGGGSSGSKYSGGGKSYGGSSYNSSKPAGKSATSEMSEAAKKDQSRAAYQTAKYKDAGGRTVEVRQDAPTARHVQGMTQERVTNHTTVVRNYYTTNHFPHSYDWYYHRPYVNVGCGYSSIFWWTLLDLSIQERALWFYNNQAMFMNGQMNRELYDQQMQNAQLRAEVQRLQMQNAPQQPGYTPASFQGNSDLMLDTNYVQAAYQPPSSAFGTFLKVVGLLALSGFCCFGVYFVFFRRSW